MLPKPRFFLALALALASAAPALAAGRNGIESLLRPSQPTQQDALWVSARVERLNVPAHKITISHQADGGAGGAARRPCPRRARGQSLSRSRRFRRQRPARLAATRRSGRHPGRKQERRGGSRQFPHAALIAGASAERPPPPYSGRLLRWDRFKRTRRVAAVERIGLSMDLLRFATCAGQPARRWWPACAFAPGRQLVMPHGAYTGLPAGDRCP